jgi:general stress protein 26
MRARVVALDKAHPTGARAMDAAIKSQIIEILVHNNDLSLATIRPDGYPQATIVSYVSDGLSIYFGTSTQSQKAKNIAHCNKVSLTVAAPYASWDEIQSLSMAGIAARVTDAKELDHAGHLMIAKFPETLEYVAPQAPDLAIYKITPGIISVLDYTKGFGNATLVTA